MTHFFVVAVLPSSVDHQDRHSIDAYLKPNMYRYDENNDDAFSTFHDYYLTEYDGNYRMESIKLEGKTVSEIKYPEHWIDEDTEDFPYWFLPNGEYQSQRLVGWFGNTYVLKQDQVEAEKLWKKRLAHIRSKYANYYCIGLDCHV